MSLAINQPLHLIFKRSMLNSSNQTDDTIGTPEWNMIIGDHRCDNHINKKQQLNVCVSMKSGPYQYCGIWYGRW